ncbi:MAG: alpha/beta hydrolase [Sulfurimonas sp.]|jgi:uncharacterized protein|nr:alpha/beta hydrolase [Sulfurimonas sp.]
MIYIAFLIFIFFILLLAFYEWQYYMVFSPVYFRDESSCSTCQMLSIVTDDGKTLEGIVYEPSDPKNTLLFFVGRSHDAVGLMDKLKSYYPKTRLIAFNYRAYGKSTGSTSEKNIKNDGLRIAEIVHKNYGDFYTIGYSLGSSVAAFVASKHKTKGLFLIGVFDSIASLAKSKFVDKGFFPMIDLSNIFRYKFRTAEYVKIIDADTYLFVSKHDDVTYIRNAREVQKNVKNLQYYLEVEELSHKEILWDKRVIDKIREVVE